MFVAYHAAGIWRRGVIGHPIKLAKGHVAFLAPINLVEEIAKPISLSLRLFGNIFAGGIMVTLIALFPAWIMWAPNAIWKAFDLFVGLIQAFIFSLLTILYFGQAMELDHDDESPTIIRPSTRTTKKSPGRYHYQLSRRIRNGSHYRCRRTYRRWSDHGGRRHRCRYR